MIFKVLVWFGLGWRFYDYDLFQFSFCTWNEHVIKIQFSTCEIFQNHLLKGLFLHRITLIDLSNTSASYNNEKKYMRIKDVKRTLQILAIKIHKGIHG